MPEQRMYTVASVISLKFGIVWTRSTALARAWASQNWQIDAVLIDVWPTTREDQAQLEHRGEKEQYA